MKDHVRMLAVAVALLAPLSVPAAQAADVRASIPFAFSVNGTELPPGRYTFKDGNGPLLVAGHGRSAVVLTLATFDRRSPRARVVFARSGEHYALVEAWSGTAGRRLPETKVRRELARLLRGGRVADVQRVVVPAL